MHLGHRLTIRYFFFNKRVKGNEGTLVGYVRIISQGVKPVENQKKMINIGFMAVRELERSDPDYCDILCEVDERFKKL